MRLKIKKTASRAGVSLLVIAVWLLLWKLASYAVAQEILVPAPLAVFDRLIALASTADFWLQTGATLLRVVGGFAAALVCGTLLSVLMHLSPVVRVLFRPLLSVIKATPVPSFIILALVWIKSAGMPVFIAFLMVLPVVCANLTEGLAQVDAGLLEMAAVYRIRGSRLVREVYVPSVTPYLLAACETGIGLAWKAGVSAEVIGRTARSIGNNLYESKLYLETVDLFAWTVVVIILSKLLELIIAMTARRTGQLNARKGEKGESVG